MYKEDQLQFRVLKEFLYYIFFQESTYWVRAGTLYVLFTSIPPESSTVPDILLWHDQI